LGAKALIATESTRGNGRIRIISGGFHILPRRRSQAILRASAATLITDFSLREFWTAYRRWRGAGLDRRNVSGTIGEMDMTKLGLYVALEARPGKEAELAEFLIGALPLVEAEPATTAWFALRMGPSSFGIFDAFADEAGREAHLAGEVAKALMAKAPELLAKPPSINKIDVLADKLPG
jgi:quinol monooxygenase YgiN